MTSPPNVTMIEGSSREIPTVSWKPPIVLKSNRASIQWISKTEAMLRVYEKEEADAVAAHAKIVERAQAQVDASRDRVRTARTNVAAVKAILAQVQVEQPQQPQRALAAPKRVPVSVDAVDPEQSWSPRYVRCIDCGTTDAENRPHFGRGRCQPCHETRWPKAV